MATGSVAAGAEASTRALEKQPPILYLLFATEAWERFSYYGMRAILKLYMVKGLLFSHGKASLVYGFYSGLVYLTPLAGGLLADRVTGYRAAILAGGVTMAAGQFLLSVPGESTFWAGLACLIVGNGLFKPNISTIVGTLYDEDDPRRDRGFTIFYMGINLGAWFSPFVCGQLLGENEAWLGHNAFAWGYRAAGIGMLIGFLTFFFGQRALGDRGRSGREVDRARIAAARLAVSPPAPPPELASPFRRPRIAAVPPPARRNEVAAPLSAVERGRIVCIFIVGLFVVFFWMAFEQAGNTMTTWADENTNRVLFGWEMKASLFQSVNPFFIIALAPVASWTWHLLERRGREPSTPAKMALGLLFLGAGFVPMVLAALEAGRSGRASWAWLVLAYLIQTIGELCLSPVGLSFVTKLAPRRLAAMLMGAWFLAVWAGNTLAGITGYFYDKVSHPVFFGAFVVSSTAAGLVLLALLRPLERRMGGVK